VKRALALCLCLALPAMAQDVAAPDAPLKAVVLEPGQAAPSKGLFLSEPLALSQAKRVASCEAERDSLKANMGVPLWLTVTVAVLAAGAGAAVTYAAVKTTK